MRYEIEWSAAALRELGKPIARRILTAVTKLGVDPRPPGVRALPGKPYGMMRLRVGNYRVVYVVQDDLVLVTVVRVAHRSEVYRRLRLCLARYCASHTATTNSICPMSAQAQGKSACIYDHSTRSENLSDHAALLTTIGLRTDPAAANGPRPG